MTQAITVKIQVPDDLAHFHMPEAVQARLQHLLDRQDAGEALNEAERQEAEGLADLADLLSLLRMRSECLVLDPAEGTESAGSDGQAPPLPDYSARRRRIFGNKILPNMVLAARAEERW
jgi:hypothetical protein